MVLMNMLFDRNIPPGECDGQASSGDDSDNAQMFDASEDVLDRDDIDVEIIMHPYVPKNPNQPVEF